MTLHRLMLASLWRFRWTNAGVLLGVAVTAAVITGALIVGDSMRSTLRATAEERLGNISHAIVAGDRFITDDLVDQLGEGASGAVVLTAVASTPDGSARANDVKVCGVDSNFSKLFGGDWQPKPGEALLSASLMKQLGVANNSTLILRMPELSALPIDASLVNASTAPLSIRVTVSGTVPDKEGGRFGLRAEQRTPINLFVDRAWLAEQVERAGRANLVFMPGAPDDYTMSLDDMELSFEPRDDGTAELTSPRVFLDASIEQDLADLPGQRILTYLVNTVAHGEKQSPYAMVCATNTIGDKEIADGEVLLNTEINKDLNAKVGDTITLTYYLPDEGDKLVEASAELKVAGIVPIEGAFADRTLTPDFPGLNEADSLRRWDAGPAIDRSRIRDEDEAYWDNYKATPKAFVGLETGQRLWSNRFGTLTAIRFDIKVKQADLLERIKPGSLGLAPVEVREQAIKAAAGTVDFGQLFLSLSGFIIIAAVVLAATLFAMSIEQRARQIGTLYAVGLTRAQVLRLMVGEGLAVAVVGAALGAWGGIIYAQQVIGALGGVWSDAVAGTPVTLSITSISLVIGPLSAVVVSVGAMLLTLWAMSARPARELIAGAVGKVSGRPIGKPMMWLFGAVGWLALGVFQAVHASKQSGMQAGMTGFIAGAALLIGLVMCLYALLARQPARRIDLTGLSLIGLSLRNLTRRRGRTLAAVVTLGCGVFLVLAVSGFRLGMVDDPADRASGTGGFALIVQTSQPIRYDLDSPEGREHYWDPDGEIPPGVVVPMRMNAGDDASCLNLNQTPRPRVLGVDPGKLAERGAFSFISGTSPEPSWALLENDAPQPGAVPAIADANTAQWALKLAVGDTLTLTDERGQPFDIQLVATIDNTILQGSLIISEQHFERLYPSVSGHRLLLVDSADDTQRDALATLFKKVMVDEGVTVTHTDDRLAEYNTVQNTYLTIFQALGGLGVVLGALGLGVIAARNLLERRAELALLTAVGLGRGRVVLIAAIEHGLLLIAGLSIGIASAYAATTHTGKGLGGAGTTAALTAAAALLAGALALVVGLRYAFFGRLTTALRND